MKIALVHDWLTKLGGAERVLIEFHRMFPEAPIYTLFYDKAFVAKWLPNAYIRSSFLQKLSFIQQYKRYAMPLMPLAIESFDLSEYDTVLSSSVIFSKGVIVRPKTRHICYCYSPSRMLWDRNISYENNGWLSKIIRHFLRIWDLSASARVDKFLAISETVGNRIRNYYNRDSNVIYPPLTQLPVTPFDGLGVPSSSKDNYPLPMMPDFYLIVARLFPFKNIDVAVDAFNKLGYNLAIVGDGPLRKKLESRANKNIFFTGSLDDGQLATCYSVCKALIMPQEEDFGLTPIEAMSFGKPVLALRRGGALETIQEGITGEFFDDHIPEALADGVKRLNQNYATYNPEIIRKSVEKFSLERFRQEILSVIQWE